MKNIANYISISRIIMSMVLFITKTFSLSFYIIYIYCGLSDMVDGLIARKLRIESEIGSKIDSVADLIFVLTSLTKILPVIELNRFICLWILFIVIIKIFSVILGYIYYKKIVLLHTYANKITGLILFIIPLLIGNIDIEICGIITCIIATISAVQELWYIKK